MIGLHTAFVATLRGSYGRLVVPPTTPPPLPYREDAVISHSVKGGEHGSTS